MTVSSIAATNSAGRILTLVAICWASCFCVQVVAQSPPPQSPSGQPAGADSNYIRGLKQREKELRAKAESLRRQRRYEEAKTAGKQALNLMFQHSRKHPTEADRRWLLELGRSIDEPPPTGPGSVPSDPLQAKHHYMREAERLRRAGRHDAAIAAAQQAVNAAMQSQDQSQWADAKQLLLKLQQQDAGRVKLLTFSDKKFVIDAEYRDRWFNIDQFIAQEFEQSSTVHGRLGRRDLAFTEGDFREAVSAMNSINDALQTTDKSAEARAVLAGEMARAYDKLNDTTTAMHYAKLAAQQFRELFGEEHWRTRSAEGELRQLLVISGLPDHRSEQRSRFRNIRRNNAECQLQLRNGEFRNAYDLVSLNAHRLKSYEHHRLPMHAVCLLNLAAASRGLGNYSAAVEQQRHATALLEKIYGADHPDVIDSLHQECDLLILLGDYREAQVAAARSHDIAQGVWGETSAAVGASLQRMGAAHALLGNPREALADIGNAVRIITREKGPDSPLLIQCYLYGGHAFSQLAGNTVSGEKALKQARASYEKASDLTVFHYANKHPGRVASLAGLAELELRQGRLDEVEKHLSEAIRLGELVYGRSHSQTASLLVQAARVKRLAGDNDAAQASLTKALDEFRFTLDSTFLTIPERQQLLMTAAMRSALDEYLTLVVEGDGDVDQFYSQMLAWKGAVLRRQASVQDGDATPEQQERKVLQHRHNDASERLAAWKRKESTNDRERQNQQAMVQLLTKHLASIETQLAKISPQDDGDEVTTDVTAVSAALPKSSALVDFLEYDAFALDDNSLVQERRLAAFVVRKNQPVVVVRLGDAASIGELVDRWRREILARRGGVVKGKNKEGVTRRLPQYTLRERVWLPLQKHLGEVESVLISPDGVTARIPWAALPGSAAEAYLLEEINLIQVAVPARLPEILARREGGEHAATGTSLLAIGGVDFDEVAAEDNAAPSNEIAEGNAAAARAAVRAGNVRFDYLPGTKSEVEAVVRSHRAKFADARQTELLGSDASELRFRQAAAKHNILHVATHGFFSPAHLRSSLDVEVTSWNPGGSSYHPGMLCGIALAGANRPVDQTSAADDGILTALEVGALDLRDVELVVLSACETGLGEVAGGEGVLGLQRAFEVAGAQSTVTSLWKVDDQATTVLMSEFYRGAWQEQASFASALRQAQLAMLQRYDPKDQKLRPRGLALLRPSDPTTSSERLSPYFWAPFVFSGNWR